MPSAAVSNTPISRSLASQARKPFAVRRMLPTQPLASNTGINVLVEISVAFCIKSELQLCPPAASRHRHTRADLSRRHAAASYPMV